MPAPARAITGTFLPAVNDLIQGGMRLIIAYRQGGEMNFSDVKLAVERIKNFDDKAFKAYYFRNVLQIPGSYATAILGVSPGQITQAGTDRNVYYRLNGPTPGMTSSGRQVAVMELPATGTDLRFIDIADPATLDKKATFEAMSFGYVGSIDGTDVPSFQVRSAPYFRDRAEVRSYLADLSRFAQTVQQVQQGRASRAGIAPQGRRVSEGGTTGDLSLEFRTAMAQEGYRSDQSVEILDRLGLIGFNPIRVSHVPTADNQGADFYPIQLTVEGPISSGALSIQNAIRAGLPSLQMNIIQSGGGRFVIQIANAEAPRDANLPRGEGEQSGDAFTILRDFLENLNYTNAESIVNVLNNRFQNAGISIYQTPGIAANGENVIVHLRYSGSATEPDAQLEDVKEAIPFALLNHSAVRYERENNAIQSRKFRLVIARPGGGADIQRLSREDNQALLEAYQRLSSSSTSEPEQTTQTPTESNWRDALTARQLRAIGLDSNNAQRERQEQTYLRLGDMGYSLVETQGLLDYLYSKGFYIFRIRPTAVGSGYPFRVMEIQEMRNSESTRATRFQSGTWVRTIQAITSRNYVVTASGVSVFQNTRPRGLVSFSTRLGTLTGAVALPDMREYGTRNNILSAPANTTSSTESQTTTASTSRRSDEFVFLGYQDAPRGQIYQSGELDLVRTARAGAQVGRKSYILYFGLPVFQNGMIDDFKLYQIQTGPVDFGSSPFNSREGLNKISQDTPGKLKLRSNNSMQRKVATALLTSINQQGAGRFIPERISGFTEYLPIGEVPFADFTYLRSLKEKLEEVLQNAGGSLPSTPSEGTTLTENQMKDAARERFKDLTFGWELECYIKQGSKRPAADALNAVRGNGLKYKAGDPENLPVNGGRFGLVNDGSIDAPDNEVGRKNRADEGYVGYDTAEVVSPILEGERGLRIVEAACNAFNATGIRVNSTDGLHIHFDGHGRATSPRLEAWQIANIMINYQTLLPVIDLYQNVGRTGGTNRWAMAFRDNQMEELRKFSNEKNTDYAKLYKDIYGGDRYASDSYQPGASSRKYHDSRYRLVNFHAAWTSNGTIEFRQGSPSTDSQYIINWILFLFHLIEVSKKGYFKKPEDSLGPVAKKEKVWTYCELMLPDDVASYIANSTYIIDGETVEQRFTYPRARDDRRR